MSQTKKSLISNYQFEILPACLKSEAGVFLSRERAGVTVETMGLPLPGDGTETKS